MENNIINRFLTEIFVRNFRKHFRKKNLDEKTVQYFIFMLMENNILLVYIYTCFFTLEFFTVSRHM